MGKIIPNINHLSNKVLSVSKIINELGYSRQEVEEWVKSIENSNAGDLKQYFDERSVGDAVDNNFSRLYLVFESDEVNVHLSKLALLGAFTLSISTIDISKLTRSRRQKIFGGSSYQGLQSKTTLPTLLLGRVLKNTKVSHKDLFFTLILSQVLAVYSQLNEQAALSFLSLDCKEEVYNKVYKNYGFELIDNQSEYYSCGMNVYKESEDK